LPHCKSRRLLTRRLLIRGLGYIGLATVIFNETVLPADAVRAGEPTPLDVNDPAAQAQGYVEDAAQVNPKKFPTFVSGQSCANCLLLQGKEGETYRPCDLFPGKLVKAKGWCKGWAVEM